MNRSSLLLALAFLALLAAGARAVETDTPKDMRGDEGLLMDLRPTGAVFLAPDRILVTDARNNQFHIFDPEGRRYRRLDLPRTLPAPWYSGLARMEDGSFLVTGDHYHDKNVVRYVTAHSVLHRYTLDGERFTDDSAAVNYDPDTALRRTGYFGQTVSAPLKIEGIAVDSRQKRLFLGLSRPVDPSGEVLLYEARLDEVMNLKRDLDLKDVKAKLTPETEPSLGVPFHVSDLCYVPGKGLLVLMASQSADGKRFGSNQLWLLRGGFGPARLVARELAPGNRAAGVAVREDGSGAYTLALTFDNNPEETGTPSRLLILPGVKL